MTCIADLDDYSNNFASVRAIPVAHDELHVSGVCRYEISWS